MPDRPEELAELFKAVADTTRLRLVKLLAEAPHALCVNALTARLGVTQSAVSQHLRVLRQAGLVRGERCGNQVHYSIDRRRVTQATKLFMDTLGKHLSPDGDAD
jgi:ArsR family transcriptional regulator